MDTPYKEIMEDLEASQKKLLELLGMHHHMSSDPDTDLSLANAEFAVQYPSFSTMSELLNKPVPSYLTDHYQDCMKDLSHHFRREREEQISLDSIAPSVKSSVEKGTDFMSL